MQTAATNDANPGNWTAVATTSNTVSGGSTVEYNSGDLSNSNTTDQWIRFGVLYTAGATGLAQGSVDSLVVVRST